MSESVDFSGPRVHGYEEHGGGAAPFRRERDESRPKRQQQRRTKSHDHRFAQYDRYGHRYSNPDRHTTRTVEQQQPKATSGSEQRWAIQEEEGVSEEVSREFEAPVEHRDGLTVKQASLDASIEYWRQSEVEEAGGSGSFMSAGGGQPQVVIDRWGQFKTTGALMSKQEQRLHAKMTAKEREREIKWLPAMQNWQQFSATGKLKERVRKGIPNSIRPTVWQFLVLGAGGGGVGVEKGKGKVSARAAVLRPRRRGHENTAAADRAGWRRTGAKQTASGGEVGASVSELGYRELLARGLGEEEDKQIKKDLPRTMQCNVLFQSTQPGSMEVVGPHQAAMYRVAKAYALRNPTVGYCQSMASLIALLLQYEDEEVAFRMLCKLMEDPKYQIEGLYTKGMPQAQRMMHVLDVLLQRQDPKLHAHFKKHDLFIQSWSFRWLTLRFHSLPMGLHVHIMDIFLLEGPKILYRMALYLVSLARKKLLGMSDMGDMLKCLYAFEDGGSPNGRHGEVAAPLRLPSAHTVEGALKIKLTTKEIRRIEHEYDTRVALQRAEEWAARRANGGR